MPQEPHKCFKTASKGSSAKLEMNTETPSSFRSTNIFHFKSVDLLTELLEQSVSTADPEFGKDCFWVTASVSSSTFKDAFSAHRFHF